MVPEDVNEAKGSRRSRGRIVVRLGIPSRENFIIRRCDSKAALAGKRDSETGSSTSRSPWGVRHPGASISGCRNPKAWITFTSLSDRRNSIEIF